MSTVQRVAPVWSVCCDHPDCDRQYTPDGQWARRSGYTARRAAEDAGWQVRPVAGPGSRTDRDYCPEHRTDGRGDDGPVR